MLVNVPNPANNIQAFMAETSRAIAALASVKLGASASPAFNGLTLNGLTASRLISTDSSKKLASTDLVSWVTGTANRVTVADDGDGTITLSGPQDLHTAGSPTFADLTLSAPSNIYALSHDSFTDFVADEHVAHSGVTLTAGNGLTGGGDISANRSFAFDSTYSPEFAGLTLTGLSGVLKAAAGVVAGSADHADLQNIGNSDHHNPVTLGTANGLSLSTQELSLPTTATPQFAGLGIGEAYDSASLINLGGTISGASFIFALDFCPALTSTGNFVYSIYSVPTAVTLPDTKTYTGITLACSSIEFTGGATTGKYQCIYTLGPSSVTGTVNEAIGVFIGAMKQTGVTTGYGIYQTYSNDINYFNGNSGFGTNNPQEDVHAADTVRADTAFNLNGTDGLSGTLTLDDGANWRITLTFSGGILTGQTTGASSAATATWV